MFSLWTASPRTRFSLEWHFHYRFEWVSREEMQNTSIEFNCCELRSAETVREYFSPFGAPLLRIHKSHRMNVEECLGNFWARMSGGFDVSVSSFRLRCKIGKTLRVRMAASEQKLSKLLKRKLHVIASTVPIRTNKLNLINYSIHNSVASFGNKILFQLKRLFFYSHFRLDCLTFPYTIKRYSAR